MIGLGQLAGFIQAGQLAYDLLGGGGIQGAVERLAGGSGERLGDAGQGADGEEGTESAGGMRSARPAVRR